MGNFIDRLTEAHVREWYAQNWHPVLLNEMAASVEDRGYVLDQKSGLFLKPKFDERTTAKLGYTATDILLLRSADFHVHRNMGEGIRVKKGMGAVITGKKSNPEKLLIEGSQLYIRPGLKHAFRPNRGTFLEMELFCTEVYTTDKETTLKRFDQFKPWVNYYSQAA